MTAPECNSIPPAAHRPRGRHRLPALSALSLALTLLVHCARPSVDLPSIDDWSGEPQVAAKIEEARQEALDDPSADKIGRLGAIFHAHALYSEAVACYRLAAEKASDEARWPHLAALATRKIDPEASVPLFEQAIERGADHPALFVALGDALAELGRPSEAEESYRRALEKAPATTHAHYGLARLALGRGETEVAVELLENATGIAPWHGELHTLLAQAYQRLGRTEDAERELLIAGAYPDTSQAADPVLQSVEMEGVNSMAYLARGRRLARAGRFAEAEEQYRRVIELKPATAGDHSNLGGALAGQGKIDEAIEHYRKALELDPADPFALNNLAMALADKGDFEGAVERLNRAVEIEPNYPEAHHNLGLVRARQRRLREAIAHYEQSIAQNPSFARAFNDLGSAQAGLGEIDAAIESWRRALEIDRREMSALYNLGVALSRSGRHAEAIGWLRRGLEIAPNSSRIASLLAWELATAPDAELRDGAEAVALARRVYDAYPGQPSLGDVLAAALAEEGRFDAAIALASQSANQARVAGQADLAGRIENRLSGYRQGRPYRQPS